MTTFCFVCVPAPGHSTMISSLASVLVANANATPEKVVPCSNVSSEQSHFSACTYKVYADDKLRLAAMAPFNLSHLAVSYTHLTLPTKRIV